MAELVALVGAATPQDAERRERLVRHAAERVPGVRTSQLYTTPQAAIAVVHSDPDGGSQVTVSHTETEVRAMLAITPAGLAQAWSAEQPRQLGAEAGHVQIGVHDGVATVSGDGVAFVPGYWASRDGEFAFSTHLASIVSLGAAEAIDDQGAIEYLVHLHPWGRRTLLDRVSLVGQGGLVRWQDGRVDASEEPIYPGPSDEVMTDSEAVAEFADVWAQVIADLRERSEGRRTLLALSGGMDSRAIAAAAVAQHWHPMTYTYGSDRVEESAAARLVAQRLGLANLMIPVIPSDCSGTSPAHWMPSMVRTARARCMSCGLTTRCARRAMW